MLRKIALLGAAILISSPVSAASPIGPPPGTDLLSWPLGGIPAFAIGIGSLDQNAANCGITRDSLDTSLRFVLGQSRIRTLSQFTGIGNEGFLDLRVTVLANCAATIELRAAAGVEVLATGHRTLAPVWQEGFTRTGRDAAKSVSDAVELLAKEFVNDWNSANPLPPVP